MSTSKPRVAVIPARGGSKRIPKKNIKDFLGAPMISYAIRTAQNSGVFSRVIVSTEDHEVKAISQNFGAEVPFKRPIELSDDFASMSDVMAHAVEELHLEDVITCCIYPTTPLLAPYHLKEALQTYNSGNWEYVFAAIRYSYPPQRAFLIEVDGSLSMCTPEHYWTRSQDLPTVYHDAGQFYFAHGQAWTRRGVIFTSRSTAYVLSETEVVDIDTEDDWLHAERLYERASRHP